MRRPCEVTDQDRRRLLTATAMALATAVAVGTVLATSAFAKSAREVRRHGAEARAPISNSGQGQRWPGARYDQNGYYIDPNAPGRW